MKLKIAVSLILIAFGISSKATLFTFDLRDTNQTSIVEAGSITQGGLTASLVAAVNGGSGSLNQTMASFGINATGSGDQSGLLDGGEGAESISITFNQDVYFTGINLSAFSGSETAFLTIAGFDISTLGDTGAGNDVISITENNKLLAGQTVKLEYGSGNGFSFDSFTVDTIESSSVPDSLPFGFTVCFFLVFLTGSCFAERRRQSRL